MSTAEPRRVLIATVNMTTASGTVTYTRDLALSLLNHGWLPIVYSTRTGTQADVLRAASIPVVSSLASLGEPPDVIHGHHALETLAALTRFPGVPALFVCHDALTWHSKPPLSPRLRTIVAVDAHCRDRIVYEQGVPRDRIRLLTNVVDLNRFRPRDPLPPKPRRALVFSNAAHEGSFVGPIREACAQRGVEVDVVGESSGEVVDHPEELLPRYDLVFAKARCAIEAMAVGAAVIACDAAGMAGMVTTEHFESMRLLNFGRRTLRRPVTAANVLRELDRYDPSDAAEVSRTLRASNDADLIAEQFIEIYEELLREPVPAGPEEMAALSTSLERIAHHLYAQMEAGASRHRVLLALANSSLFSPVLRLLGRGKQVRR